MPDDLITPLLWPLSKSVGGVTGIEMGSKVFHGGEEHNINHDIDGADVGTILTFPHLPSQQVNRKVQRALGRRIPREWRGLNLGRKGWDYVRVAGSAAASGGRM